MTSSLSTTIGCSSKTSNLNVDKALARIQPSRVAVFKILHRLHETLGVREMFKILEKTNRSRTHGREARLVEHVQYIVRDFEQMSDGDFRQTADEFRKYLVESERDESDLAQGFAFAYESIRRALGITLYDVQLIGAAVIAEGRVAEMATGEGKTLTVAPAAVFHGLLGHGVHVVTPNIYLAERDYQRLRPAYELLGLTVACLPERAANELKYSAYACDITYCTGYELGFDYLRDQLSLRQNTKYRLGERLLQRLEGSDSLPQDRLIQRGLHFAIVDEIDNVLLDDAGSPLILSNVSGRQAEDADAYLAARKLLPMLEANLHYRKSGVGGNVDLTEDGIERVHAKDIEVPVKQLRRPWSEYVEQALLAELSFHRDVHYIVDDGEIRIVDSTTGRIFSDRSWQDGLHQSIEAKEGLHITAEKQILAQITRQRFFRMYVKLGGMTGTANDCEREFQRVYNLDVVSIPLRVPSRRDVLPHRFFADLQSKWKAIAKDVFQFHQSGRPVLVGTRSIADSELLANMLLQRDVPCCVLNGQQDSEEATIVASAGNRGAITIATNVAGRGTDIRLTEEVKSLGGLHVIVSECHESARIDRQLIGRCARQGDPGSCQTFVSAGDMLIQVFGQWLMKPMQRYAAADGELSLDFTQQLLRVQHDAERSFYSSRSALLRQDLARDSLMSRLSNGS